MSSSKKLIQVLLVPASPGSPSSYKEKKKSTLVEKDTAALRIQNQVRRVQAVDRVKQISKDQLHAVAVSGTAAEGIQSVFRGWCSRREVYNVKILPVLKNDASTKIQAEWRKFYIQSKMAMWRDESLGEDDEEEETPRLESEMWEMLENYCAVKIQSYVRGMIVREEKKRTLAAVAVADE